MVKGDLCTAEILKSAEQGLLACKMCSSQCTHGNIISRTVVDDVLFP